MSINGKIAWTFSSIKFKTVEVRVISSYEGYVNTRNSYILLRVELYKNKEENANTLF